MHIRIQHHPSAPPPATDDDDKPQMKPLTHHEILGLMAPFTAAGLHADLAASQRGERKLAFKPRALEPTQELPIPLEERLVLEVPESGDPRLVRTLSHASGLTSQAVAVGADPAVLWERIQAVPSRRQFRVYADVPVARSYLIEAVAGDETAAEPAIRVLITQARARVRGINIEMKADRFVGHAVELRLTADAGTTLKIPEDLTAVIGWNWRPLREFISLWRGSIRVQPKEPRRTADIEHKIGQTITHLADTLDRPPADFHPRFHRARWRVSFQRGVPLGIGLLIIALTPAIQWLDMADDSILRMLIFHAPPLMLAGMFIMREMPRIEIPPIPRPLTQARWLDRVEDKGRRARLEPASAEAADS
ncbi:hypothetical protein [Thiocystis violacea]|uniref:hypothetical protein n=1 Tax=Thiocystis violacea TaxID=13725 RepID=UPI0019055D68|nr:hypothetical protein [Thiocystis violacea]MBK1722457.1 hypothetical protein [Thiocystis violacea]